MTITSPAFTDNGTLPAKYTCDGAGVSPPLQFAGVAAEAKALVLIVDDPDAPSGLFTHWLVYDISPDTTEIPEGVVRPGVQGTNDFGGEGYGGACPPTGTHRYYFRLYALNAPLGLKPGAPRKEVEAALQGKLLETAELMCRYQRATEPSQTIATQNLGDYTDDRDTRDGQVLST